MRRQPGGYYWRQHIAAGLEAERTARQAVERLQRMTNSSAATQQLLTISLQLATIQEALSQLKEVCDGSRD